MTEIICPTCGARCEAKVVHGVILKTHMTAIPFPDLTKLREAWKAWDTFYTRGCETANLEALFLIAKDNLMQAVKELLEGNK